MKKGIIIIVILAIVIFGIYQWVVGYYNRFIEGEESVKTAWAQVETQYQRRFDLIPNVVATVKGSANFQQDTFTEVTAARSAWAQAGESKNIEGQIQAASNFESALSRLLVTVEAYPDLDVESFKILQTELEGTENRISVARQDYNTVTKSYNVLVRRFPGTLFAGLFGFETKTMFESAEGAEKAPTVNFNETK